MCTYWGNGEEGNRSCAHTGETERRGIGHAYILGKRRGGE